MVIYISDNYQRISKKNGSPNGLPKKIPEPFKNAKCAQPDLLPLNQD